MTTTKKLCKENPELNYFCHCTHIGSCSKCMKGCLIPVGMWGAKFPICYKCDPEVWMDCLNSQLRGESWLAKQPDGERVWNPYKRSWEFIPKFSVSKKD